MIDCGATGYSFIDKSFAQKHSMKLIPLCSPQDIRAFDGLPLASGAIIHVVQGCLSMGKHSETTFFFVTKLSGPPIILGIPWLRKHSLNYRLTAKPRHLQLQLLP
jgi:hypothetical protein